jgi:hypothetical protein
MAAQVRSAMCSGVVISQAPKCFGNGKLPARCAAAKIPVVANPGQTAVTPKPLRPYSARSDSLKPCSPTY